jgi:hypothetical protein
VLHGSELNQVWTNITGNAIGGPARVLAWRRDSDSMGEAHKDAQNWLIRGTHTHGRRSLARSELAMCAPHPCW